VRCSQSLHEQQEGNGVAARDFVLRPRAYAVPAARSFGVETPGYILAVPSGTLHKQHLNRPVKDRMILAQCFNTGRDCG